MPTFWKKKKSKIKISTADAWCSKFIRIRDADDNGYCSCFTCNAVIFWKYIQAGHFVSRGRAMTRFDGKNIHAQCPTCNMSGGEQGKYAVKLDEVYGPGTAKMLIELGGIRGTKTHGKLALKEISKEFRLKVKKLAKEKGVEL